MSMTTGFPRRALIVNGPNLDLLGTRQPELYGDTTLDDVIERCRRAGADLGWEVDAVQSNHEGALIDAIHDARGRADGLVVNAGGLTHTSIALRDALLGIGLPFIEVHVTNVYAREPFRHVSYLSAVAVAVVAGAGALGYETGLRLLAERSAA
jgi:3-dehydroquinate dehydratase II